MVNKLISFIQMEVCLDPSQPIVGSTDLLLTGLVDSLGVIDIVGWVEDAFAFVIDPADITLENFQTPDLIASYIDGRLSARPS